MRLNKYLALYAGLSRRAGDRAIEQGRVAVDGGAPALGQAVTKDNVITLDGQKIIPYAETQTIMLNKPAGYVCSRAGQGSMTVYDLLPKEFHSLKTVGRLDKDSSGLLLLTNDGHLAERLTHPRYQKTKVYEVKLSRQLSEDDFERITQQGVRLEDGLSKFNLDSKNNQNYEWRVTMREGRNRQIRRTFAALRYNVEYLKRVEFGPYKLDGLKSGSFQAILVSNE